MRLSELRYRAADGLALNLSSRIWNLTDNNKMVGYMVTRNVEGLYDVHYPLPMDDLPSERIQKDKGLSPRDWNDRSSHPVLWEEARKEVGENLSGDSTTRLGCK